ncbi:MAG TPA: type II toxin-antitoxin system death-on-curing family toxin [Thermomicrobiales bacterium]|nr:type II toxin-antitoxin system death-on-curing family toxin [Thermomicrobiales bacterium]
MTRWLDVADVIALHEAIMSRMGWSPAPLRDEGALESAVMRAQMAAFYEGADLVHQAALLAIGISQAQAFIDGNKRTADAALELFLAINGVPLTIDPLDVARELERIAEAEDRVSAAEAFEVWLRQAVAQS